MAIPKLSPEDIISGGTKLAQAGLEGGKLVIAYGKPTLEASAKFTAQVGKHLPVHHSIPIDINQAAKCGSENPLSITYAVVGATGVAVFAVPGVVVGPGLSSMGFTASGIQTGQCNILEGTYRSLFIDFRLELGVINRAVRIIGSIAAAAHSFIGNVASGSAFAAAQSAAAGGTGITAINGVAQFGGAAMSLGSAGLAWARARL